MIDRLNRRLLKLLVDNWIMILLATGIVWVFSYSLLQAEWVRNDTLIARSVIRGMLFGWLLAISRFRGRWCAAYSLAISLLITAVSMAHIMPAIWHGLVAHVPLHELLITLNLRLWTLLYRIGAWFSAIAQNTAVNDTGLFVYLLSLIIWNAVTWFMWGCLRAYRSYPGIILLGVLLAFNVQLSGQGIWQVWFYLTLAVMLVIRTEYRGNQIRWDRRGLDYPDDGGFDWGGIALALTVLITGAAVIGSVIGTREGLRMLAEMVTVTRDKTADTAEKLFTGVTPPKVDKPNLFVHTPDLQNFGSALPQGKDVIMWVKTSDPPPPPPEAGLSERPRARYWRSKIYTDYTQRGWKLLPLPQEDFVPAGDAPSPHHVALQQEFQIQANNDAWLFASNAPIQASPGTHLRVDPGTDTVMLTGNSNHYLVTSWVPTLDANTLRSTSTGYSQLIRYLYINLPATLPARIRGLTAQVTAGAVTPYEKAIRIQEYLRSTYRYDIAVQPFNPDRDFVDGFLFETQAGYCSHFASAMVVMLRLEGVPARVVAGYSMGEYDYNRQAYRVTVDGAHAWVEVFFPGIGWVEFEPTPSQPGIHYDEVTTDNATPSQPSQLAENRPTSVTLLVIAASAGALLAAAVLFAWHGLMSARPVAGGAAGRLYWAVRGSLRWAGVPSSPTTTPDEFLLRCNTSLALENDLRRVARDVTALYIRAVFSPLAPSESEISAMRRTWRQERFHWLIYLLKQRFRMLKQSLTALVGRLSW